MNIWSVSLIILLGLGFLGAFIFPFIVAFAEIREDGKVSRDTNFLCGIILTITFLVATMLFAIVTITNGSFLSFMGTIVSIALLYIGISLPYGFSIRGENAVTS